MKTETVEKLLEAYRHKPASIIQALQDIQNRYGYISKDNLKAAARQCSVPYSYAYSIATFYKSFSLKERGRYVIKLCDGTACHLKLSGEILEELKAQLAIGPGDTTEDRLFSIELVNCLGACAMAPVASINDQLYGYLSRSKIREILTDLRREAAEEDAHE
ncbi:MAG: NAD(P)H-dependent oxidoreductase subunit E [bacterium]